MTEKNQPVAYGVTSAVAGRTRQPVYLTTTIDADGTVTANESPLYNSWQDATKAAKAMAAKAGVVDGEMCHYWIADQVKAFQKRIAKS